MKEFKKDILELQGLWKEYIAIPKQFKQSGDALQRYHTKLNEISGKYHMEKEDISLYVY